MIIINLKTYQQGTGKEAENITKQFSNIAKKTKKKIIVCAQTADIRMLSKIKNIIIFAQDISSVEYGKNTGSILCEDIKEAGAKGSLVNHSEKRINKTEIKKRIDKLKKLKMISVVCAKNYKEAKELSKFKPDYIAYEHPQLIGGKISVSEAKPEIIKKVVTGLRIPVLVGAGINNKNDIKKSYELGAKGILISSAIVTAKNPGKKLYEILK